MTKSDILAQLNAIRSTLGREPITEADVAREGLDHYDLQCAVWSETEAAERAGVLPVGPFRPFNLALHEHLIAQGYSWEQCPASWHDDGDAESGPSLGGGPAYDRYIGDGEYVYAVEDGTLDREARDYKLEAWCDAQWQAQQSHCRL